MNRNSLKAYSPNARKDFLQAVTTKAAQYGLTADKIEPMTEKGNVVLISGKPFPKALGNKRKLLEDRIKKHGFEMTMEAMAYTWFNRLVAIRYMELHGYLEHGFRVLSHPEGHSQPEILEKAQYVDLPGLDQGKVVELKLDGTKEEDLYRLLLTAQFNALSNAMPFLFEKIEDETELLLPDSLLNSDSLIRKLVTEIDEEDWKEVEIIGWLYQFYISDKKDEVIGKVVKSEDIPAATQLFTPNWIVKYLVQNTIGRQWLATYPQSSLRSKMEYYIEPAEQTPDVQEQLKAITPASLNPEELTLLDPACGSGHILVEAYDVFKAIYEERGFRSKDIPALILKKNLFGLEIDDRAAQLAAFALMMKARADYPRIFDSEAQPNIVAFVESKGLDADEIHYALMSPLPFENQVAEIPSPDGFLFETENDLFTHAAERKAAQSIATRSLPNIAKKDIASLVALFENAKTFGSLIQVPKEIEGKIPVIAKRLNDVLRHGDLTHKTARFLEPLVQQAKLLSWQYDAVVANPPYMGSKGLNANIKQFGAKQFSEGKSDLFAMFIIRITSLVAPHGNIGLMTPFVWMFLQTYTSLRKRLLQSHHISSLIQPEYHAFFDSAFVPICAFTIEASPSDSPGTFIRLTDFYGYEVQATKTLEAVRDRACAWRYEPVPSRFLLIPGAPLAYWISGIENFLYGKVGDKVISGGRCKTHNDEKHVRFHWEVSRSAAKWKLYLKGGEFRKYFGNELHVVDWSESARDDYDSHGGLSDSSFWEKKGLTWSLITSALSSFRLKRPIAEYSSGSPTIFSDSFEYDLVLLAYLNSCVASYYLKALNPTLNTTVNDVFSLPFIPLGSEEAAKVMECVEHSIRMTQSDWNASELSWEFDRLTVFDHGGELLEQSQANDDASRSAMIASEKQGEASINSIFIRAFGLSAVLKAEVPDEQITLSKPERQEDIKRLLSYSIGCTMGRYSLDNRGLIYANSGNEGFDPSQYKTFRADDDGIIPVLESDWGIRDDAANRIVEFVSVAWPKEHLDENLRFIADSLTPSNGEQPKNTIRRYLATGFYKHHLSMYKKRPIYWLFSSGKQRAFQCLVYMHRYNEGTLARMRTEYVIPLMGKMSARLEHLQGPPEQKGVGGEIAATSAVTVKRKLEKERDHIKKQLAELQAFDEKLRHYADLGITLDLDDGVKVNYSKFSDPQYGDILADVKAICGTKEEE